MFRATFKNGETVLFDDLKENGDDVLFFRGAIGLVHAQHKDLIDFIEIINDDNSTASTGEQTGTGDQG